MNLLKILILLISATWSIAVPSIDENRVLGNWSRFERASDNEFTTSLQQIQMIARITNGIYLEQGLIDGSITFTELISEILNLGSIAPSDITAIDSNQLNNIVNTTENLPNLLKETDGIKEIEERLLLLRSVVDLSNGVDKLEKPDGSFLTELEKLNKTLEGFDWTEIAVYTQNLYNFAQLANTFEKKNLKEIDPAALQDLVENMNRYSGRVKQKIITTNFEYEKLKQLESKFSKLLDFHRSISFYSDHSRNLTYNRNEDVSKIGQVQNNFNTTGTVIGEVKNSLPIFNVLRRLFGHHRSGSRNLKHVPAFSEGPLDIKLISQDLKSDWIQQVIGEGHEQLAVALNHLEELGTLAESVDQSTGSSSQLTVIIEVLKRIADVSQLDISFKTLVSKIPMILKSVDVKDLLPANINNYKSLFDNISLLFQQFKSIDMMKQISKVIGDGQLVPHFDAIFKITAQEIPPNYKKKFNDLKKSADFKAIVQVMKKIPNLLETTEMAKVSLKLKDEWKTVQPLIDPVNYIVPHFNELNNFIGESTDFLNMLNTLKGIKEFESIKPVIDMRIKLSGTNKKGKIDFSSVASSVENMKKHLVELESWVQKMNGFKSVETDALLQLGDVKKDSDSLGSATRDIARMKKVLDMKLSIAQLKKDENLVKFETNYAKNRLKSEDVQNLKTFVGLANDFNSLYSQLDTFRKDLLVSTSTKLVDHSSLFEKAANLTGVDRKFMAIRDAIRRLSTRTSTPGNGQNLETVMKQMVVFDQLGLDYANRHTAFNSAKDSLNSMDLTFAKLTQFFTPTTTSSPITKSPGGALSNPRGPSGTPGSPSDSGSQSVSAVEAATESSGYSLPHWAIVLFYIGAGAIALLFVVAFVWWLINYLNQKNANKNNGERKTDLDVNGDVLGGEGGDLEEARRTQSPSPAANTETPASGTTPAETPASNNPVPPNSQPAVPSASGSTSSETNKDSNSKEYHKEPENNRKSSEAKGKKEPKEKNSKSSESNTTATKPKSPNVETSNAVRSAAPSGDEPAANVEDNVRWPILPVVHAIIDAVVLFIKSNTWYKKGCRELELNFMDCFADILKKSKNKDVNENGGLKREFFKHSGTPGQEIYSYVDVLDLKINENANWLLVKHPLTHSTDLCCSVGAFYKMMSIRKIDKVLMVHHIEPHEIFFPLNSEEPFVDTGCRLTVKCMRIDGEGSDDEKLMLQYQFEGEESAQLKLIWRKGVWPKHGPPNNPNEMLNIWKKYTGTPKLAIVSKSGYQHHWFAFVEMGFNELSHLEDTPNTPGWANNFFISILKKINGEQPLAFLEYPFVCASAYYSFLSLICEKYAEDPKVENFIEKVLSTYNPETKYTETEKERIQKRKGNLDQKMIVNKKEKGSKKTENERTLRNKKQHNGTQKSGHNNKSKNGESSAKRGTTGRNEDKSHEKKLGTAKIESKNEGKKSGIMKAKKGKK